MCMAVYSCTLKYIFLNSLYVSSEVCQASVGREYEMWYVKVSLGLAYPNWSFGRRGRKVTL